jgi:hypothetical protein
MGSGSQATLMPAHMSSAQSMQSQMQHAASAAAHQQQQQQKSQSSLQSSANNRNNADQTSFSAVLRNLAKQQDIKDDDMGQSAQGQQQNEGKPGNPRVNEKEIDMSRQGNSSRSLPYDARGHTTIRHMSSPEPPEKKVNSINLSYLILLKISL